MASIPMQVTRAALTILSAMQDALENAVAGRLPFGALVAFAAAAMPKSG